MNSDPYRAEVLAVHAKDMAERVSSILTSLSTAQGVIPAADLNDVAERIIEGVIESCRWDDYEAEILYAHMRMHLITAADLTSSRLLRDAQESIDTFNSEREEREAENRIANLGDFRADVAAGG